ncbi:MAG: hypothetical protein AAGA75_07125 [Cyanobacteria bacterium P01_E01_bin.6]
MKFETALQDATHHPEKVNFSHLLAILESYLAEQTHHDKLSIAGNALMKLTELYVIRAERLLNTWEEDYWESQDEPVITDDMLMGFLRQSMSLDLDNLVEESPYSQRRSLDSGITLEESVAETVDKNVLLDVIDEIEVKQHALSIAHDENVSEWVRVIQKWMTKHRQGATLQELVDALQKTDQKITLVKIWLGLLLGGYILEQRGEFYAIESIWIQPE